MAAQSPIANGDDPGSLQRLSLIGFDGTIPGGLIVHPDRQNLIYGLGDTVIIEDIGTQEQVLLSEHTNKVTTIAVSKSGKYIASGQMTYMGFAADVIIWNYAERVKHCKCSLHKVKIEALAFSPNDLYLVTLGGQDDGSIIVWNIETKQAICGAPAQVLSAGSASCVVFANNRDDLFVSAGLGTLRVWTLDVTNRKIRPEEVSMGQLKRDIRCMQMSDDDSFVYCGTTTGDLLGINVGSKMFQYIGPEKERFSKGVTAMALLKNGEILVGAGDSTVATVKGKDNAFKRTKKSKKLNQAGEVTSIALRGEGHQFFCGTSKSHIYQFNHSEFKETLVRTAHYPAITDIEFPYGTSELFGTSSFQEICIWHRATTQELRRIVVPNMTCNAIAFSRDGKYIASAWSDASVRFFLPESGKFIFDIKQAHKREVTALALTPDGMHVISGGGEGQVRVWKIKECYTNKGKTYTNELVGEMKEHKATVSCIKVTEDGKSCVTASKDGTCIMWDLERFVRSQIIFANTQFNCVCFYHGQNQQPCQIIASGTDRKIGYWETFDGSTIREVEGSLSSDINGMDITADGKYFVTGGADKLIKVWSYDDGKVTHVGKGHAMAVTKVKICPNSQYIVSVSEDGAIYIWSFPH